MDVLLVAATVRELGGRDGLACGSGRSRPRRQRLRRWHGRRPDAVLHVGLAGARSLAPPALVLGSEAVYEDIQAAIPVVSHADPDAALLERAREALPEAHVLQIGTSARVGAVAGCDIEGMEGFGVLRALCSRRHAGRRAPRRLECDRPG